jgi:hypothetical protein
METHVYMQIVVSVYWYNDNSVQCIGLVQSKHFPPIIQKCSLFQTWNITSSVEWLFVNAKWAIFQPYHSDNKLHSAISWRQQVTFSYIMATTSYIQLYHGDNNLHSAISWRQQVTFSYIMATTSYIQLYHGDNKLHSMRWCFRPTRSVGVHWNNSPRVDIFIVFDLIRRHVKLQFHTQWISSLNQNVRHLDKNNSSV